MPVSHYAVVDLGPSNITTKEQAIEGIKGKLNFESIAKVEIRFTHTSKEAEQYFISRKTDSPQSAIVLARFDFPDNPPKSSDPLAVYKVAKIEILNSNNVALISSQERKQTAEMAVSYSRRASMGPSKLPLALQLLEEGIAAKSAYADKFENLKQALVAPDFLDKIDPIQKRLLENRIVNLWIACMEKGQINDPTILNTMQAFPEFEMELRNKLKTHNIAEPVKNQALEILSQAREELRSAQQQAATATPEQQAAAAAAPTPKPPGSR